jgi:tetratricopeptide (TPR) repeat protein
MLSIEALLDRARASNQGTYVHRPWESLAKSKRPALEKAWYAWVRADVALRKNELNVAHAWLQTGTQAAGNNPDKLWYAESMSAYAELLQRVEEPRGAIRYAMAAWQSWFAFAQDPLRGFNAASIRVLLTVLADSRQPPRMTDEQLLLTWLADRLSPRFSSSARMVIALCGQLGHPEPALEVAAQLRGWLDKYVHGNAAVAGFGGYAYADLLGEVANMYDELGQLEQARDTFAEAIKLLDDSPDHPAIRRARAGLQFNYANQLAKLDDHAAARKIFNGVRATFESLNEPEAALRARHGELVSAWKHGERAGFREQLEEHLIAYEAMYDQMPDPRQQVFVRQNLDSAYRLWLTDLAGEHGGTEADRLRCIGQLYSLREGFVHFATNWTRTHEGARPAVLSEPLVLLNRMARIPNAVLLIVESGVDLVVLATIRSGQVDRADRVHVELGSDTLTEALETLITLHQGATDDLVDRAMAIQSEPTGEFIEACQSVWRELPAPIRDALSAADVVYVAPSNDGNLNLIPFELIHDGENYLGLSHSICRVTSLGQLLATLSTNRVNAAPLRRSVIVRAGDIPSLPPLEQADSEVRRTKAAHTALGVTPEVLEEPDSGTVLDKLSDGVDLLHYVGHGFADANGEILILGEQEELLARDLAGLTPARAPACILSSCLVGRGRHLRIGEQQGIVIALLKRGAPAVVAASYTVADQASAQFAAALYHHARSMGIGPASLQARRALAQAGYHPTAWAAFAVYGDPAAMLTPTSQNSAALTWTAAIIRYIATGAPAYLQSARDGLSEDDLLPAAAITDIRASLEAYASEDHQFFAAARLATQLLVPGDEAEAYIAQTLLHYFGRLRYGEDLTADDERVDLLTTVWSMQRILMDSYLLIALAIELGKTLMMGLADESGRRLVAEAASRPSWLSADAAVLGAAQSRLDELSGMLQRSVMMNVQEIAGVDEDTFQRADAGDRQAQKRMLRNLLVKDASAAVFTRGKAWTDWMLRAIGTPSQQAMADLLGAVEFAHKQRLLADPAAEAVFEMIEQYMGPGEVGDEYAAAALETFPTKSTERRVIALFLLHDRLASGGSAVSIKDIEGGVRAARGLHARGAEAYFRGVWCQYTAQRGDIKRAVKEAWPVLETYAALSADDHEYAERVGMMATMLYQLCNYAKDKRGIQRLQTEYGRAMRDYAAQREKQAVT